MIDYLIGLFFLALCIAGCGFLAREQRRLLRQIRKLASLYPPYPTSDEERGENQGTTSVHIEEQWSEDLPGRD